MDTNISIHQYMEIDITQEIVGFITNCQLSRKGQEKKRGYKRRIEERTRNMSKAEGLKNVNKQTEK